MKDNVAKVQKIWDRFSAERSWQGFSLDYELHRKLFLAFQPGPYYYWVLNASTATFEMMSPEAEKVLGYPLAEITFPFLLDKVHPDDIHFLLNFEASLADFFSKLPGDERPTYKIQYDFRLQKADGSYIRVLNQMVIVQYDERKNLIRTFGVQTDISHLKKDIKPVLSFISLQDGPSYFNVEGISLYDPSKSIFSKREKQVLGLMLEGMASKEICEKLNISKYTVDSHRKHLLEKTQSRSIPEMVKKAIVNGWI